MPGFAKININCDHRIRYDSARDLDGNYLNNGSCSYVLSDAETGDVINSDIIPYVPASNGRYQQVLDKTYATPALITVGKLYKLVITFVKDDYDDEQEIILVGWRKG